MQLSDVVNVVVKALQKFGRHALAIAHLRAALERDSSSNKDAPSAAHVAAQIGLAKMMLEDRQLTGALFVMFEAVRRQFPRARAACCLTQECQCVAVDEAFGPRLAKLAATFCSMR